MILGETDISSEIPEEFHECEVIFEDDWSTYEECGWIIVFDFFGEMFSIEGGNYVFSDDNNFYFDPQPVTDLEKVKEWWND